MTHDKSQPDEKRRPFPWHCFKCAMKTVHAVDFAKTMDVRHDDTMYSVRIPRLRAAQCSNCGEMTFDNDSSEDINAALRLKVGLLAPEQIRSGRGKLGLSTAELAARLGVSERDVADWEDDLRIQSRAIDNLLRVFFAVPEVRTLLVGVGQDPNLGTTPSIPTAHSIS